MVKVHTVQTALSAAYLVPADGGLVLVDTGAPGAAGKILKRMQELDQGDLRLIVITHAHYDHYGSAAALRRLTGAPVAVHEADADAMRRGETRLGSVRLWGKLVYRLLPLVERLWSIEPVEADITLRDGDDLSSWGVEGSILHTPGHTDGSISLLMPGCAIAGDLVSTVGWPRVQGSYAQDWSQLAQSLQRLQRLGPTTIYAGHGKRPMRGEELRRLRMRLPT